MKRLILTQWRFDSKLRTTSRKFNLAILVFLCSGQAQFRVKFWSGFEGSLSEFLWLVLHIFQEYIAQQINVWCPNWEPNLHISHITNFQMYFNNIQVNWIELSSDKIASVMSGVTSYHYYPWTFLSKRSKSVQSSLLKPTCSTPPLPSLNFVCLNTIMGLSSLNRILITRFLKQSFA